MAIVFILSGIAVVTFNRVRQGADDTAAATVLAELEVTQRFFVRDNDRYITSPLDLDEAVGQYLFLPGSEPSRGEQEISVAAGKEDSGKEDSSIVAMSILSNSGNCLVLKMEKGAPPVTDTLDTTVEDAAPCTGVVGLGVTGTDPWRR